MKSLILLLLLAIAGEIQSQKSTDLNKQDTGCKVILPCPEFDFYAASLVKAQQSDKTIEDLNKIIGLQRNNMAADSFRIANQQQAVATCNSAYNDLINKQNKTNKKLKFFKNTTLVFISVTGILIGLLLLVLPKH